MAQLAFAIWILVTHFVVHARDLNSEYKSTRLKLGKVEITAYIADTDKRRADGLMFVKSLAPDTGMIFVFEEEMPRGFWMKNTILPLSIGYFDRGGVLFEVIEMKPASSLMELKPPTYESKRPAMFALEMPKGWFKKRSIPIGAKLQRQAESPSPLLNKLIQK